MRILFTACPGYGHALPLLQLARTAQRRDHEVVFATGPDLAPEMARRGLTTWAVGPTFQQMFAFREGAEKEYAGLPPEQHMLVDLRLMFGTAARIRAAELLPRVEQWRPDVVVHEPSEFAGGLAAEQTGARDVVHGLGQMPHEIPAVFAPTLEWLGTDPESFTAASYIDFVPPALQPAGPAEFAQTLQMRPTAGEVRPGDMLPRAFDALPHADTVYVTMGTVFQDHAVLTSLVEHLRKLPVNVVATTGPATPPDVLGPQPDNVLVASYLPQALLLPRARLIVSHGGAGTVYGGFVHGLPQVVLPQGADQFLNAGAAATAGAALVVESTGEAVAEAVDTVLTDPSFTDAASTIRDEIDQLPTADDVLDALT